TSKGNKSIDNFIIEQEKAKLELDKAVKQVIKSNKGLAPEDIETKAYELAQPKIDKIAQDALKELDFQSAQLGHVIKTKGLPDPKAYQEGTKITNKNGQSVRLVKGKWVKVK